MTNTIDDTGSEWLGSSSAPPTTEPPQAAAVLTPGTDLPPGVHPLDQSVPLVAGRPLDTADKIPGEGNLPAQGQRTLKPWAVENEKAFAVNQRAAHDWSANSFTLNTQLPAIQLVGRLRGAVSTKIWVPSTASTGILISPDEGDVNQGAGVQLNPGDSIELATEGTVWAGLIPGQTSGTVNYVRLYNPPGGGLGLSSV